MKLFGSLRMWAIPHDDPHVQIVRSAPQLRGHLQGPVSRATSALMPARSYRPSSVSLCRSATRKAMAPSAGSDFRKAATSPFRAMPLPDDDSAIVTVTGGPSLTE